MAEPELLWSPSPERVERAQVTRFAKERGLPTDYPELWQWSVDNIEDFWAAIWDHFGVQSDTPYERVLGSHEMPGAQWFAGSTVNYAEHAFRDKPDDKLAIQHDSELRDAGEWTWGDLRRETARVRAILVAHGVEKGDRVAAYMPNIPETIAAFFATASLGAIWSSAAPEFGVRSVVDRFQQIEPKVLLAIDGYRYGGKDFDRGEAVAAIAEQISAPVVRFGYLDGTGWGDDAELADLSELEFVRVPFDHPLWVLYSSGTTGLPKPIVHGHGGMLLEHLKKMHLHVDADEHTRFFWFTTTGWMMWNFVVGVLLTDASVIVFDGNPGYPDLGRLWDLAESTGMTTFGTSAAFIASCMKAEIEPAKGRDLTRLEAVGSTGSPLAPEGFAWIYEHLGEQTWLFSTSGGTDVCTAFVGGVPVLPVYRGELQCRALGADIQSWDDDGKPLIGQMGELVIAQPMPCMPVFFWGDDDGSRYRESYFSMYPGIWRHGDWIEITGRGTAIIYGRSDSTINRGGIRMGTSEIYSAVLSVDEVVDALVVDVPQDGRENWMPLFVVLREGAQLDDDLTKQIARRIREDCSPRHVPDEAHQVEEIPRTLSGKVLEVPVKKILMGQDPDRAASRESLANPAAFDWFVDFANSAHQ